MVYTEALYIRSGSRENTTQKCRTLITNKIVIWAVHTNSKLYNPLPTQSRNQRDNR